VTGSHEPVHTRPRASLFRSLFGFQRRDRDRDGTEGLIAPRSPGLRPTTPTLAVPSLHDLPSRPTSPGLLRPPLSPRVSSEYVRPVPRPPQRSYTSPPPPSADGGMSMSMLDAERVGLGLRRVPSAQRI
jgi:hypothetical protein